MGLRDLLTTTRTDATPALTFPQGIFEQIRKIATPPFYKEHALIFAITSFAP